ncbi:MAG: GspE/PulE family protein, partial [Deltaproteobacteria bacterium]|nr:GspE/PulE family protein [Deltaproteobacteria bacterium]
DDIHKMFDSERLTIYAVDYDKKEIYSKFVDSAALGEIKEIRLPINERSIAGFVAMDRRVVNISDAYDKAELAKINPALSFDSSWDEKTGFRTKQVLTVPALSSNELVTGVFQLINKRSGVSFTLEDEGRVQEIARTLGIALFNEFQLARKKLTKFDYLLSSGFVTQSELDATITEAREKRRDVESLLMEKYKIAKKDIGKSLSLFYKCPFVDHEDRIFIQGRVERLWGTFQDQLVTELRLAGAKTKEEAQAVLPELVKDINLGYLKANFWIPLRCDKDKVEVAIDDPYSFQKIQDIRRLFPGREIKLYVGLREDILKFVNSISLDPGSDVSAGEGSITGIIDELKTEEQQEDDQPEGPVLDENDNAVVRLANQIVVDAYRAGASDIHIEPRSDRRETVIRFRVDGDCYEYQRVPPSYRRALTARFKIMGHLDITERRKPQDGKIKFRMSDREIELRVATIPTQGIDNEDVVMRILAASEPIPLDKLNMSERNLREFKLLVKKPYGIILCVGPTGSGKTTTLHSALGYINKPETKIWTAEDPVEITQYGLRQVQVQPKIGFDFAAAMRAFLRADPDVIMVGEMRDKETADIGIEASLTGHLVLTTLHTNSAIETVTRLLEMGMEPFNFADALLGVLAQRLVRTICRDCKERYHPSKEEYDAIAYGYGEEAFAKLGIPYDDNFFLYRGKGCDYCNQSGYKGRTGLHELLVATDEIKSLILARATVDHLFKVAVEQGMATLLQDGVLKSIQGWTDYKQVKAVAMK